MKILIVGGGGREHAIIRKLKQSPEVDSLICAPGNAGIATDAKCFKVSATDIPKMVRLALDEKVDYVVVTPDDPLALGMVDALNSLGIATFGPTQAAARIESSKIFSKRLMEKCGVLTARAGIFSDAVSAKIYIDEIKAPVVIKADGLAKGKGVLIANSIEEAYTAVDSMMSDKVFGNAGQSILIEEFLIGTEISVMCFVDGKNAIMMPSAQDHKRRFDGDLGKNTGGMGAFSPSPMFTPELKIKVLNEVILPIVREMEAMGCPFSGVLYAGLMITSRGVYVLEFNARFGDPETQVVLPLIENDLLELMMASSNGTIDKIGLKIKDGAAATVAIVSDGYPDEYELNKPITIDEKMPKERLIHAGTKMQGNILCTGGGRVFNILGFGATIEDAVKDAYSLVPLVSFCGADYRRDIGGRRV
ncbi:MAG: phosphoribosylamine--glycine ligase [Clostridia bacterium]